MRAIGPTPTAIFLIGAKDCGGGYLRGLLKAQDSSRFFTHGSSVCRLNASLSPRYP